MDDFRISSGFRQGAFTDSGQSGARAAAFRRAHRVGQILHGTMLRWAGGGKAWVQVGGQELVAELRTRPDMGVPLRFLVEQLVPDIILRELDPDEGAPYAPRSVPEIVRAYYAARDAMDALLHARPYLSFLVQPSPSPDGAPHAEAASPSPGVRLTRFCAHVGEDADLLTAFLRVQQEKAAVNRVLAQGNAGMLLYLPWLLPQAYGVEMLLPRLASPPFSSESAPPDTPAMAFTMGARLPHSGHTLARCLAGRDRIAYRLFVERPNTVRSPSPSTVSAPVADILSEAAPQPDISAISVECLGIGPLPPGMYDVLTSALPPQRLGGLHRRA